MYMYPIIIKKEPQKIRYHKEIELDGDVLTLAMLRKHVDEEDQVFSVFTTDAGLHSKTMLSVYCERTETDEEVRKRVESEEKYMKNYTEFHSKKAKQK